MFSPYSVDYRVQHRRYQQIHDGQQVVSVVWYVLTNAMGEEGEKSRDVEGEDDTSMGRTGAEGLQPGIFRREGEDSMEYLHIRQSDEGHISPSNSDNDCQTVKTTDGNVSTSQFHHSHVLAVRVRDYAAPAIWPHPYQEGMREH